MPAAGDQPPWLTHRGSSASCSSATWEGQLPPESGWLTATSKVAQRPPTQRRSSEALLSNVLSIVTSNIVKGNRNELGLHVWHVHVGLSVYICVRFWKTKLWSSAVIFWERQCVSGTAVRFPGKPWGRACRSVRQKLKALSATCVFQYRLFVGQIG